MRVAATILMILCTAGSANAKEVWAPYNVTKIIDGDTVETKEAGKIRLWGFDTPERGENYYRAATNALKVIINEAGNVLQCRNLEQKTYKRTVMHCRADNLDLGGYLVRKGYARDYKFYSGGYYSADQKHAKKQQLGIWKTK